MKFIFVEEPRQCLNRRSKPRSRLMRCDLYARVHRASKRCSSWGSKTERLQPIVTPVYMCTIQLESHGPLVLPGVDTDTAAKQSAFELMASTVCALTRRMVLSTSSQAHVHTQCAMSVSVSVGQSWGPRNLYRLLSP